MWLLKSLVFLSLINVILTLPQRDISSRERKGGQCAFGDEYDDGCNHCICHGKSGSTCTKIPNCSKSMPSTSSNQREIPESPKSRGHCTLGPEFIKDCNICTCQGELGYICTKKECVKDSTGIVILNENRDIPSSPTVPKGKCILGHKFFSGCDLCSCYGEYFGYRCTRMENCTSQKNDSPHVFRPSSPESPTRRPIFEEKSPSEDHCPKGQSFFDGYYYCVCRADHLGYACKSTLQT